MQKVLEKFEDNPDVVFLFINTWQREKPDKRTQLVSNFIRDNEYSFRVLMDEKVEQGSDQFRVVEDFKVNGIPTKFVIDGDGQIRFKSVGGTDNIKEQLQKISMMVEIAQRDAS